MREEEKPAGPSAASWFEISSAEEEVEYSRVWGDDVDEHKIVSMGIDGVRILLSMEGSARLRIEFVEVVEGENAYVAGKVDAIIIATDTTTMATSLTVAA